MLQLQDMLNALGSGNHLHEAGFADLDADVRSNYIANTTILGLEQADLILIVGANPRVEAPVFNARCSQVAPPTGSLLYLTTGTPRCTGVLDRPLYTAPVCSSLPAAVLSCGSGC